MQEFDGFELITRRLCLVKDTGHAGVLWGGNMMAWVDEAGAIYSARLAKNPYVVTKAFTEIDFKHQVRPGDFVDFWGKVVKWGTTSLTLEIKVVGWRPESKETWEVLDVKGVFVALDAKRRKTKIVPVKA
ncbi:MAG: acyl-CoA thioesterase [Euryarchaeota archaeon]|nr:acyl-CoA thioesterase [Euryarchaeota archaeon]